MKRSTTAVVTAVMAILTAACLTACSSSDDTSSKSGTVSLATETSAETTTTTATTTAETTTTTEEATTTTAETTTTTEETTTTTEETTTTTEETTTTTAETTTTTAETTTTTATETEPVNTDTLESKSRIQYNGYEFAIGDRMSEVEGNLGSQPAPSAEVASCLSGDLVTQYYFYGMIVEVKDDVIFSVNIMDNGYYGDATAQTSAGLACNMATSDAVNLYGDSNSSDELNYYYTDGTYSMQVSFFDGIISSIWISDSSLD